MKYKNILLINPYNENKDGINPETIYQPLGLAYLASVLKDNNIPVKILDANVLALKNKQIINIISSHKPDLVGISLNIANAYSGIELSQFIKKTTDISVCLGGPFASSNIEHVLRSSKADFTVVGEGENTFLKICNGQQLSEINGIAWKPQDNEVIVNKPSELIQNLDEIPIPAYNLLPQFELYRSVARRKPMAAILTSRGCPYGCTFCNSNIFGKTFRAFSAKRVISEMEMLISQYGIKQFAILDDNFLFNIDRIEEILDLIIEKKFKILINIRNGMRTESVTYPLVKKMKKAGVYKTAIGCESAHRPTLREIKKNLNLEKVKQVIEWCRKEKIIVTCYFILGFPNDTPESISSTINFAIETNPNFASFAILIPLLGTGLHSFLEGKKLLDKSIDSGLTSGFFGSRMYHKCFYLKEKEIYSLQAKAYGQFYLRFSKISEIISNIKSLNELKWYIDLLKNSFPIAKMSIKQLSACIK